MTNFLRKHVVASRICKYRGYSAPIFLNVLFILCIWNRAESMVLLLRLKQKYTAHRFVYTYMLKHTLPGKNYEENCGFTFKCLFILFSSAIVSWIAVIILQSGDIELNPGPYSDTDSIISSRSSIDSSPMSIAGLSNHLSMVHYT